MILAMEDLILNKLSQSIQFLGFSSSGGIFKIYWLICELFLCNTNENYEVDNYSSSFSIISEHKGTPKKYSLKG